MYLICYLSQGNWAPNYVVLLWLLMYNSLRKENYLKILRDTKDWLGNLIILQTHPDIAYLVSVLSQFMSSPTVSQWAAVEPYPILLERSSWMRNIV